MWFNGRQSRFLETESGIAVMLENYDIYNSYKPIRQQLPPNSNFDPNREFNDRLFKERNYIIYHPKGIRTGKEWAKSKVRFHIRITSNPRLLDSLTSLLNAKTVYCTTLLINQMRKDNNGVIQTVFSTEFCFECLRFQTQFEKVPLVLDEITLESDSGDNESGEGTSSSG
ncbi:Protein CBG27978 [Caenorhabditis briggsae]|uniref:Protein CBG27978 n=2 Tax=Caenorhabditis briggsae TaxID=6238 RepID=B6IJS0_CAEBR|nr:Protein CBG27978 [Caenorhabditis briggsae]ULT83870.1 hypothetical protein L3Y34_012875 [Caenorhabditis briggsae]CAS00150.1 Protein CBG27978 [Caenorhabditis briggsae]